MTVPAYAPPASAPDAVRVLLTALPTGALLDLVAPTVDALPVRRLAPHCAEAILALYEYLTEPGVAGDLRVLRDEAHAATQGHLRALGRATARLDYARHAASYWTGLALHYAAGYHLAADSSAARAAVLGLLDSAAHAAAETTAHATIRTQVDQLEQLVAREGR